ncbi:MAG TPA: UMP kinase [Oculatellaceae cyanobacterium]
MEKGVQKDMMLEMRGEQTATCVAPGTEMTSPKFKRILLKLSGEALMGKEGFGIDPAIIGGLADEIKGAYEKGVQIAIVVGGGNIFRGVKGSSWGMDKAAADYVGMLATIMNCLILQEVLKGKGVATRVQTAIAMPAIAEPFIRLRAIRHLEKNRVVIFGGGTGNPHVTTDTAAALRAAEIGAEVILMAKNNVDGVYSADPRTNPTAQKIESITFEEMIRRNLRVMDPAAVSICEQNKIPLIVFDSNKNGSIERIVMGDDGIGTHIGG